MEVLPQVEMIDWSAPFKDFVSRCYRAVVLFDDGTTSEPIQYGDNNSPDPASAATVLARTAETVLTAEKRGIDSITLYDPSGVKLLEVPLSRRSTRKWLRAAVQ